MRERISLPTPGIGRLTSSRKHALPCEDFVAHRLIMPFSEIGESHETINRFVVTANPRHWRLSGEDQQYVFTVRLTNTDNHCALPAAPSALSMVTLHASSEDNWRSHKGGGFPCCRIFARPPQGVRGRKAPRVVPRRQTEPLPPPGKSADIVQTSCPVSDCSMKTARLRGQS